jgi:TPR repeat protein
MADVAHTASDPASTQPGIVVQQQTSRADSSDKGKLRVFISYSREDLDFVDQLRAGLDLGGFEWIIDYEGISGGEDWRGRLSNLISEADTVIFVLTPTSALSEICAWEVQEASRLSKRIVPVIVRPLEGASPPPELRERNYIFFYGDPKAAPGSGFGTGLAKLVAALNTDFDWLREHTRYLQRAIEWDRGGRPANRLLSGDDIAEAKAWAARRPKNAPETTSLHLDFILASEEEAEARSNAQRKQLEEMAAAQTERETALYEREEALKQAADAQRKRVTIRNIALVVVSIFAVLANWLYVKTDQQRKIAEEQKAAAIAQRTEAQQQRAIAEAQTAEAQHQRAIAEAQRAEARQQREEADRVLEAAQRVIPILYNQVDIEIQKQVFAIFQTGADRGDAFSMHLIGWAYERQYGVTRDYAKAREWYEKAADKGYAYAMGNLGALYHNGRGVAQDYAKAHEWYEKAAGKGDAYAMGNLGALYHHGRGVAQDYAKAREWYEKAADGGNTNAKALLEQLRATEEAAGARRKAP